MTMYYYASKLSKGPSSSSKRHSSSSCKTPPTRLTTKGSNPCCSTNQCNGPLQLPPLPPCVTRTMNGGTVTGGNYRFQPPPHQHHQCNPHQHQYPQQQNQICSANHHQSQQSHHQQCRYNQQQPPPPQQCQPPPYQKEQQHPPHGNFLNSHCCCCSGGAHTPCRQTPPPFPLPVEGDDGDGESGSFHNDEDNYDNETELAPIICRVHSITVRPAPASVENSRPGCDSRGAETGHESCGLATTSASSLSPSFDDDDGDDYTVSPPQEEEENKDLIFNGPHLISGTWEALIHHLLPTEAHFLSEDYVFTFLLSARLYLHPHELLLRIFQEVIDLSGECVGSEEGEESCSPPASDELSPADSTHEKLSRPTPKESGGASLIGRTFTNATGLSDCIAISEEDMNLPLNVIPPLVQFIRAWSELFPYDFRDDRMMAHVRILAHKCVTSEEETTDRFQRTAREQVSLLLATLHSRLAALEKYEEFLHRVTTETSIGEPIAAPSVVTICSDPVTMAEQLTLVELQRFSAIGPEEFVQTLGKEDLKTGERHCDCVNRKTKNLEAYVQWFQRLTYYVASEICKMSKKKSRCRVCEYWVQVAKECLNIRNFNSLIAILAGLNIRPVARLKKTLSKPIYAELTQVAKAVDPRHNYAPYRKLYKAAVWQSRSGSGPSSSTPDNQTYRILVPYFSLLMKDVYNLDSMNPSRLKNGHIDFEKCRQLAKLVQEIMFWQKVKCDFVQVPNIFNSVQASPIFGEQELIYASYLCEPPATSREKEEFKKLHKQNIQVPLIGCNSSSENDT